MQKLLNFFIIFKLGFFFRYLGYFKGKHRLAKFLIGKTINNIKDITINSKYKTKFIIPNIKENIGFDIFIDGIYEEQMVKFIINKMSNGGVFIDVGANIGTILIPVSKSNQNSTNIAIEASPRIFQYLKNNIELNKLNNCVVFNYAVNINDNRSLNFYSPIDYFGKGSLSNVFTNNSEQVKSITIDTLLSNINLTENIKLIKVDIEGYEYHAFKSAEKLLNKNNSPDIIFEFVDWAEGLVENIKVGDAQKLLLDYGYTLYNFQSKSKISKIESILEKGYATIYATKE